MGSSWKSRGTYGRILKRMIIREMERYERGLPHDVRADTMRSIISAINTMDKLIQHESDACKKAG